MSRLFLSPQDVCIPILNGFRQMLGAGCSLPPSRSAMVRATRKIRSWDRAVRPMRSKAERISDSPVLSRRQNCPGSLAAVIPGVTGDVSTLEAAGLDGPGGTDPLPHGGGGFRRLAAPDGVVPHGGTLTWRSIRSSSGPEIFPHTAPHPGLEQVRRVGWDGPRQPQRQGSWRISWNRAGRCSVPLARATVTVPSSRGWRMASSTSRRNSGSSSRTKTPLWARDISPGRRARPPRR